MTFPSKNYLVEPNLKFHEYNIDTQPILITA